MADKNKADEKTTVATHRKARQFFEILETFEAGLVLAGPEVKALRSGQASLDGCFARSGEDGALWLENFYIPHYAYNTNNEPLDPRRKRKLLMHKNEFAKIGSKIKTKGLTLVPLEVYFRRGWAKVALGLAKGKTGVDRRDDLKKKALRREAEKSFKGSYRG